MTEKQEEVVKRLTNGEKIDFNTLVRTFKKEGIENFVVTKKEYIETVLNMLQEKDKIIDLLLDKLNQNYNTVFKNNEVKEIIEIYEKIKNISDLYGIKLRKECIKQYFERKVEN